MPATINHPNSLNQLFYYLNIFAFSFTIKKEYTIKKKMLATINHPGLLDQLREEKFDAAYGESVHWCMGGTDLPLLFPVPPSLHYFSSWGHILLESFLEYWFIQISADLFRICFTLHPKDNSNLFAAVSFPFYNI